jgi:toxin YoeB
MSVRVAMFSSHCLEDVEHWVRTDRKVALRLIRLVRETLSHPFEGLGKPEPLRGALTGLWSRRLTQEHRLVYEVTEKAVRFVQARYHYE